MTNPALISLRNDFSTYLLIVKPAGNLAEQLNCAADLLTSCQNLLIAFVPSEILDDKYSGFSELLTLICAFNQSIPFSRFAVSSQTITVGVRTSVNWQNNKITTITHTVTSTDGTGFDSGIILAGTSYSKTFNQAGTYMCHYSMHPSMTGKVIVQS